MTGYTSGKLHILLICFGLTVVTFIAFEGLRHNDFINCYDDNNYVTENPNVNGGLTVKAVLWAMTATHAGNWHPLTWVSHIVDCEIFGLKPLGHHITSLFIHIANTLLLFWVLKKMTGVIWPAAFVAAMFTLHPLHVESVAWAAERKDVLSGFFWMLTIAAYVRYAERPGIGRYILVIAAYALGLMAKPMLVTLPFVLLILDWWPLEQCRRSRHPVPSGFGRLRGETVKAKYQKMTATRLTAEKIPLFALAAVSSVITYTIQKSSGAVTAIEVVPLGARIANALVSYIKYIGKLIYPSGLAVLYPHPGRSLPFRQAIAALLILTCITVCVIYAARHQRRYLAAGWLWYLVTLVPVSGLVQVGAQAMADRYTYLPSIGFFIMVGYGAADIFSKRYYRRIAAGILSGLAIAALVLCTRAQVRYWQNSLTLFERAVAVTKDNYKMHSELAGLMRDQSRFSEAISHYRRAVEIIPNDAEAHYQLGDLLRLQGDIDRAIEHYLCAVRIKPDYADAHNNLGYALMSQGKLDEAIVHFRQALQARPDWSLSLNGLAQILATHYDPQVRDANEAMALAERAAKSTRYQNATIVDTLAISYAAAGQFEKAVETAQKALDLALAEKNDELARQIRKRLELFKAGKPYRLSAPSQDAAYH